MDKDRISGLKKGLDVIECFDEAHPKLTIAEVSRMSGLSRAAARRCLLTLDSLGYAAYDGKYFRLTPKILRLGFSFLSSAELPQIIQPTLETLNASLHEGCSASILDGTEVVYIARAGTKRLISVGLHVGARLPAFCSSSGRVLVAALDPAVARQRLEAAARPKLTARTVTDVDQIMAILDEVRADGYCFADQELELGLTALAVPVATASGQVVAALNVGTQSHRFENPAFKGMVLEGLLQAASTLRSLISQPISAGTQLLDS